MPRSSRRDTSWKNKLRRVRLERQPRRRLDGDNLRGRVLAPAREQPVTGSSANFSYRGYGIGRWLLGHAIGIPE